jgi:hypothetical protein
VLRDMLRAEPLGIADEDFAAAGGQPAQQAKKIELAVDVRRWRDELRRKILGAFQIAPVVPAGIARRVDEPGFIVCDRGVVPDEGDVDVVNELIGVVVRHAELARGD